MRKFVLILVVLAVVALAVIYYPAYAEKPMKDGKGPLAVQIDPRFAAPEYHSPLEWWQTHHYEMVNNEVLLQGDCLHCHEQETSCNNCHDYVGAQRIVE